MLFRSDQREALLEEKEARLEEKEKEIDKRTKKLEEESNLENETTEIDNTDNNNDEMIYQETPTVTEEYIVEDYDVPEYNYGIRNVSIYEGVANYAPDMYYPITVDIKIYITPIGQNSVERIGGTYTVDYGTTVLEALHAAFGVGVEDGKITEIGGIKASDLGYKEFIAEWSSVSLVKEVNMSGHILQPDDSIAIYKK